MSNLHVTDFKTHEMLVKKKAAEHPLFDKCACLLYTVSCTSHFHVQEVFLCFEFFKKLVPFCKCHVCGDNLLMEISIQNILMTTEPTSALINVKWLSDVKQFTIFFQFILSERVTWSEQMTV